jgi:hypothetical protein
LHDWWEGDVLKETTMANERWWKGPGMVALTSIEPVLYWLILAHKPKQLYEPRMDFLIKLVGGEAPQELNEGMGVNHPSVIALRPDHEWWNSCHMQPCRQKLAREEMW